MENFKQHAQSMKQECDVQFVDMSSNMTNSFVSLWNEICDPSIFFQLQIWARNNLFINENNLEKKQSLPQKNVLFNSVKWLGLATWFVTLKMTMYSKLKL